MNARGKWIGRSEFLNFTGLGIEPSDVVGGTHVRNPEIAVFIRSGAERHAVRSGHIVFGEHNFQRVVAYGRTVALYFGMSAGDFGSFASTPKASFR